MLYKITIILTDGTILTDTTSDHGEMMAVFERMKKDHLGVMPQRITFDLLKNDLTTWGPV